jgi:hypothetical protein
MPFACRFGMPGLVLFSPSRPRSSHSLRHDRVRPTSLRHDRVRPALSPSWAALVPSLSVMAGLVPAIHVFLCCRTQEARRGCPARRPGMTEDGAGHDGGEGGWPLDRHGRACPTSPCHDHSVTTAFVPRSLRHGRARPSLRHGRACPGHPRFPLPPHTRSKTWMPGTEAGHDEVERTGHDDVEGAGHDDVEGAGHDETERAGQA